MNFQNGSARATIHPCLPPCFIHFSPCYPLGHHRLHLREASPPLCATQDHPPPPSPPIPLVNLLACVRVCIAISSKSATAIRGRIRRVRTPGPCGRSCVWSTYVPCTTTYDVHRAVGAGRHQVCEGGGAASGGESFPGSLQISTTFVCFPTFGYVYLSHFVQFIFVDVNALV